MTPVHSFSLLEITTWNHFEIVNNEQVESSTKLQKEKKNTRKESQKEIYNLICASFTSILAWIKLNEYIKSNSIKYHLSYQCSLHLLFYNLGSKLKVTHVSMMWSDLAQCNLYGGNKNPCDASLRDRLASSICKCNEKTTNIDHSRWVWVALRSL